jgi:hypothetical protein
MYRFAKKMTNKFKKIHNQSKKNAKPNTIPFHTLNPIIPDNEILPENVVSPEEK